MARNKSSSTSSLGRFSALVDAIQKNTPALSSWLVDEDEVVELRIKHQADGTFLAIAKGLDEDGGPVVCFGSGYGAVGCLLTLDAAINGNRWRVDKPWSPKRE